MLINYKNVTLQHDDDMPVLENVDFQVNEGEYVYIIGKVGAGKSSLLRSIYCELEIDEADEAIVFDRDLTRIKRKHIPALRKQMGIVFQDFQLLHDRTLEANLDFVLQATGWKKKSERQERIQEVLEAVGLPDKIDRMPHELSGGEQQRASIARAILNKPQLIIADEPTGNLDPETANSIISLLREIANDGTTVVMSTHNMSFLSNYPGTVYLCEDHKFKNVTDNYGDYIDNLNL